MSLHRSIFTETHLFAKGSCSSSQKCLIKNEQSNKVNLKMIFIEFKDCELKALELNEKAILLS